ncbi:MAG: tRNA nucleotidyltransferase (CCA-adding enzyme) [Blastocatellia bacterium]|jgi:tRNA nucleotidyltransferase (CCA-adding enzyme)|nr:tRNA nucleotidyltransferase (CCA-adding enzyme) [Blastocatellia bacterium]
MSLRIPDKILRLARVIRDAGGRALMVGGCVRDRLMQVEPKDWDLEVYGVEPARLRQLLDGFGHVNVTGEAFTVYKLGLDLDVSLPRRERKTGRGHRAFVIEGDPLMTLEEATKRRDFTINAILEDPLTGEVIDPFDGRADLRRKALRAVSGETFAEDSLRVLRAAQFAARFEFELEPQTIELCRAIDLTDLPRERVWGEMEKLLLLAPRPSTGLKLLYELGAVEQLFPEMKALAGVPQEYDWHPEGDVDVHTLLVTDRARELIDDLPYPKRVTVMLAALCHDFGKPATTAFIEGRWRSRGHEEAGVAPTESFLERLNVYTLDGYDVRAQVIALVRDHLKPGELYRLREEIGDGAFRRLARKCELDLLYRVARADSLGRNASWVPRERWYTAEAQEWFINRARELAVETSAPAPLLMGRHLLDMGLKPSRQIGDITRAVYEMQLDGRVQNLEEAKAAARELLDAAEPRQSG